MNKAYPTASDALVSLPQNGYGPRRVVGRSEYRQGQGGVALSRNEMPPQLAIQGHIGYNINMDGVDDIPDRRYGVSNPPPPQRPPDPDARFFERSMPPHIDVTTPVSFFSPSVSDSPTAAAATSHHNHHQQQMLSRDQYSSLSQGFNGDDVDSTSELRRSNSSNSAQHGQGMGDAPRVDMVAVHGPLSNSNIRVVYEKFRGLIDPKSTKKPNDGSGTPQADVSGILGKKIIDRLVNTK